MIVVLTEYEQLVNIPLDCFSHECGVEETSVLLSSHQLVDDALQTLFAIEIFVRYGSLWLRDIDAVV